MPRFMDLLNPLNWKGCAMKSGWLKTGLAMLAAVGTWKAGEYGVPVAASAVRSVFTKPTPETSWRFSLEVVDGKITSNSLAVNVSNGEKPIPKPDNPKPDNGGKTDPPVNPDKPDDRKPTPKPDNPPPPPPSVPTGEFGVSQPIFALLSTVQSPNRSAECKALADRCDGYAAQIVALASPNAATILKQMETDNAPLKGRPEWAAVHADFAKILTDAYGRNKSLEVEALGGIKSKAAWQKFFAEIGIGARAVK